MDGFNKMALAAAAARVIDINKSEGKMEKDPQLKYKLFGHTVLTLCIAIFSGVLYIDKPDDKTVVTEDTFLATLSIVAIANFLLSALNTAAEFMKSEAPYYDKLVNGVLNTARNTMTSLSLIIGSILFGIQSEPDTLVVLVFVCICIVRLLDCVLDVGGMLGTTVQCPDETEMAGNFGNKERKARGGKLVVAAFAFLALGTCIGMLLWHIIDNGLSFEDPGDDILLLVSIFTLGLHELLMLVTLMFQLDGCQVGILGFLGKSGSECDDASVHSLNEIPIVSAAVYTYNLLAISLAVGIRLDTDLSVNLLGSIIALLAVSEIAGRRMV